MLKKTKLCTCLALAFGSGLMIGSVPAFGQDTQRVEITGSSIKRGIATEGALPVQTISKGEIDKLGVQTTEQLLQTVAAMSSWPDPGVDGRRRGGSSDRYWPGPSRAPLAIPGSRRRSWFLIIYTI